MLLCASAALQQNKQHINDLNVFPVPDGDTGTNMSMTMESGALELRRRNPEGIGEVAKCAANAFLRGARGNSGVILSLLFRGMSKSLKGRDTATAYDFSQAMAEGVEAAYKAVMKPAEGTILTVSRMAAEAASDFAETGTDIELMLSCALESAKDALANTVELNPVLKKAGVIDAGGKGYTTILEAMLGSLRGEVTPDSYDIDTSELAEQADFSSFDTGEITFTYCTEFIVGRENNKSADLLRGFLQTIGDSAVVVDDEEIIKTHVHTNDPGKVLTEALTYGSLLKIKIENMREQHSNLSGGAAKQPEQAAAAPLEQSKDFGTVVVCAGKGIENLFSELGADGIVTGGQTMNPSTEDILTAVEATPAHTVFVFPNNKNIIMAAEQCAPLTDKKVVVIPTKTVAQGISALLNLDTYSQTEEEIIETSNEAIESVHTSLITYAARDSDFDGYKIKAGEYLGLLDGALVGSDPDIENLIIKLSEKLDELDPEFVTVYYGEDVDADAAQLVGNILSEKYPHAETSVIDGGQPVYYYMISAE
ncbi:MAG: DAK2 domain-containing protein [Clostridiales bacterium]|nr:DAK2 domain-containing protein [Clostridiales bacterium]